MNKDNFILIILVVIVASFFFWGYFPVGGGAPEVEKKTVTFYCDDAKTIEATFYIGEDRFVDLGLSDGRLLRVPKAISASGARYATEDESFVFWNKGDTAFITEGADFSETYTDCVIKDNN